METVILSSKTRRMALGVAERALRRGLVVVCPTDTVYGFLADADDKKAVAKIYRIKRRLKSKPLPLFVKDMAMAKSIVEIDARQEKILKKHWPGKYTFVLKTKTPKTETNNTLALRMPRNAFALALLKKVDRPLAQTSVNISGQAPLQSAKEIIARFGGDKNVALLIDAGTIKKSSPSKVLDIRGDILTKLR